MECLICAGLQRQLEEASKNAREANMDVRASLFNLEPIVGWAKGEDARRRQAAAVARGQELLKTMEQHMSTHYDELLSSASPVIN
jgi:hypothetical protein